MPNLTQDHQTRLILASASTRRRDLLEQIQILPDQIIPANIDETPHRNEMPGDYALRMAVEKAEYIAGRLVHKHAGPIGHIGQTGHAGAFVLAGDTVVAAGRRILPKAETAQQARDCLAILSGRQHRVYGGIALHLPNGQLRQRLVQSHVRFRRLSPLDINQYIESGDWRDKSGGYAIQGLAAQFIRDISGSYSNIVGFSLYDVAAMLGAAGWRYEAYHVDANQETRPQQSSKDRS